MWESEYITSMQSEYWIDESEHRTANINKKNLLIPWKYEGYHLSIITIFITLLPCLTHRCVISDNICYHQNNEITVQRQGREIIYENFDLICHQLSKWNDMTAARHLTKAFRIAVCIRKEIISQW